MAAVTGPLTSEIKGYILSASPEDEHKKETKVAMLNVLGEDLVAEIMSRVVWHSGDPLGDVRNLRHT